MQATAIQRRGGGESVEGQAPATTSRSHSTLLSIGGLAAGLFLCGVIMGHFTTFFTADSSIKYLAARAIAQHPADPSIAYPFARFDPSGRYVLPLTAWLNGRDYAGYSLPFLYLTALFVAVLGPLGTVMPAILGTIAALWAQAELADLLEIRTHRWLVLTSTLLATPLLFYSLTLWEHTWGVGLLLAGLVLLLKSVGRRQSGRWGVMAGLLLLGSVLARREIVLPALVLLATVPLVYRSRKAAMASISALLTMGTPLAVVLLLKPEPFALGLTHAAPGRQGIVTSTSGHAVGLIDKIEWLTAGGYATLLFVAATTVLLVLRVVRPRLAVPAFATLSVVCGLAFVVQLLGAYTWSNEDPLSYAPILVWALWLGLMGPRLNRSGPMAGGRRSLVRRPDDPRDRPGAEKAAWTVAVVAVVGAVAVIYASYDFGGAQWGPRYLLFVFPLGMLLVFKANDHISSATLAAWTGRLVRYAFVCLLSLSVLLQGVGVMAIVVAKTQWSQTTSTLAAQPSRYIVSTGDPSIDSLSSLEGTKTLLWAATRTDLNELLSRLAAHHAASITLVCGPRTTCPLGGHPGWIPGGLHRLHFIRYAQLELGRADRETADRK